MMRPAPALWVICAAALALVAGAGQAVAAPGAPTIAGPTGVVSQPPSYTITGDPGSTIRWRICNNAGGTPNNCQGLVMAASPASTGPLPSATGPDGDYMLIALQQLSGQPSPATSVTFTLNSSAPAPTAPTVTGPAALVNDPSPSFTWTSPAPSGTTFSWEIHGGGDVGGPLVDSGTTGATSVKPAAPLADGTYAFRVSQVLAGGTLGPWSASRTVTVDLTPPPPPQITSAAPPPDATTPSFTWSGGEPGGAFRWRVLDGSGAPVAGPTSTNQTQATVPTPLAAGSYTFDVVALDAVGNVSQPAQLAFSLAVPTAAPPPSVDGLVLTPGVGQIGLNWTLAPTPGVAAVRIVRRDGVSPTGPADPAGSVVEVAPDAASYIDPGLTPGTRYYYAVYARNAAGVFSPVAAIGNAVPTAPPPPPPVTPAAVPPGAITPPGPAVLPVTAPPTTNTPTKPTPRPLTLNARLLKPAAGTALRVRTPLLRWRGRPGGTVLFNLQIFDARGRKVFKAFPRGQSFRVPAGVLKPGKRYFWRVWAWFGPVRKFSKRPLGVSYFEFKAPRISASTPRKAVRRKR